MSSSMNDSIKHDSREGFHWTKKDGLKRGLPSSSVIQPGTNLQAHNNVYDTTIIGAGYTGLTAARDLTTSGLSVLLLEARDRIGGRTWTSTINGHQYELGGQYVHWGQPNLWRELSRYSMQQDIDACLDPTGGPNISTVLTKEGLKSMSKEENAAIMDSAFQKFINIDGDLGKSIMPLPYDPTLVSEAVHLDELTLKDRINQIQQDLEPLERTILEGLLLSLTGGKLETTGFFGVLVLWALCAYSLDCLVRAAAAFKLRRGQSDFARRFFQEALDSQKLSYAFNCPVASVKDRVGQIEVITKDGLHFWTKRVICTVPLNVLSSIYFDPPVRELSDDVLAGINSNQSTKLHVITSSGALSSWDGLTYPHNRLVHASGEGTTSWGDSHLVCFGASYNHIDPEDNIEETLAAVKIFHQDIDVKSMVFHDWSKDEYSKGGWCSYTATAATKYLGKLRASRGKVILASSDWALGWRGFIDGAIEEGTRAAFTVKTELAKEPKA
ncbi:uncharacterized protein Z520_09126 [Fonsecaea multimorphosa CBS 102226]|uniref:Amine oxidase n=1 Tax=Fonsecaea multimorphosa CBS 102226 TaxID=1442371 RepID=A0A0D2H060_9EURO|nr:uncharacterized protein Z520_09126 [Fonsecaea multimorphosa CBS 102226]KIX95210.1 hypothetical protein Z520_09126 [Fonsecaea multimorphosa CBS 102226]OAL17296.1 hypothetical protein AYO22_11862 [Fonsecaea multimorphosa]